jgi:hypothetical protein
MVFRIHFQLASALMCVAMHFRLGKFDHHPWLFASVFVLFLVVCAMAWPRAARLDHEWQTHNGRNQQALRDRAEQSGRMARSAALKVLAQ